MNGHHHRKQFFIDGAGGTGKTFIYNCLIHILRGQNRDTIAVAFTGIAANLLPGGRTAHSAFKLPVDLIENAVSDIRPSHKAAQLIRDAALIIWDEISMAPKYAVEALNMMLQDCVDGSCAFGGKVVVFGGDFRQILPVVRRATPTVTLESSLLRCELWYSVKKLCLTVNMRAGTNQQQFSSWLLELGKNIAPMSLDGRTICFRQVKAVCHRQFHYPAQFSYQKKSCLMGRPKNL